MKLLLVTLIVLISIKDFDCLGAKDWTYSFDSIKSMSSHPDIYQINLRPKRISKGQYGLSGQIVLTEEMGDSMFFEAKAYRSDKGNSDYKLLPFKVNKSNLYKFMKEVYVDLGVMKSIKDCSNFIQNDADKWEIPIPAGTYDFKECLLETDAFPNHLQTGFYKVIIIISDEAAHNITIDVVAKIERSF